MAGRLSKTSNGQINGDHSRSHTLQAHENHEQLRPTVERRTTRRSIQGRAPRDPRGQQDLGEVLRHPPRRPQHANDGDCSATEANLGHRQQPNHQQGMARDMATTHEMRHTGDDDDETNLHRIRLRRTLLPMGTPQAIGVKDRRQQQYRTTVVKVMGKHRRLDITEAGTTDNPQHSHDSEDRGGRSSPWIAQGQPTTEDYQESRHQDNDQEEQLVEHYGQASTTRRHRGGARPTGSNTYATTTAPSGTHKTRQKYPWQRGRTSRVIIGAPIDKQQMG